MYPEIHVYHFFTISTYWVFFSILFSLLVIYTFYRAKKQEINPIDALDLGLAIMIGGFLGARFFHVFFEEPEYYLKNPAAIFYFWQGGFVFYGGMFGSTILGLAFLKIKKFSANRFLDFYAPIFALGYSLGRISCLLTGCCYGKICELPWGISIFSLNESPLIHRHPTQLYATLWEGSLYIALLYIEKNKHIYKFFSKASGSLFFFWLFFHGWGRILMEYYRDDFRGPTPFGFSISAWISIAIICLSGGVLLINKIKINR